MRLHVSVEFSPKMPEELRRAVLSFTLSTIVFETVNLRWVYGL